MSSQFTMFGITPIINAAGPVTHLSASPIAAPIAAAMASAAQSSVDIAQAQGRASLLIAEHTGADAGIVTSGASAGLLLGAAACMTGLDPAAMDRLPDTVGMRNEFVVPRSHRNSYDHAVRAAGGRLVEAGVADRIVGVGVRDTECWELEAAITPRTAGFFYVARPESRPQLAQVAALAHAHDLPVLVDAAAELPPAGNLKRFLAEGADLVVFSGGKALGGPSASGILCGRRTLVAAALLQQLDLDFEFDSWQPPAELLDKREIRYVPRNGIGRSCKVGKEQIIGLLMALQQFAVATDAGREVQLREIAQALLSELRKLPPLGCEITDDDEGRGVPRVVVTLPAGVSAERVADALRAQSPSIRVDASRARAGKLVLIPTCLQAEDAGPIATGFARALRAT